MISLCVFGFYPAQAQINAVINESTIVESVSDLMDALFQDPTNLQLNFRVMQAQIAEGNLEGAEATLDRVLILDPDSTLAKILIADIKIKLGKFSSARLILDQLITDPATPGQTRDRAEELAAQINEAIDPVKVRGGYAIYAGVTGNAYGRSEEGEILLVILLFQTRPKKAMTILWAFLLMSPHRVNLNFRRQQHLNMVQASPAVKPMTRCFQIPRQ